MKNWKRVVVAVGAAALLVTGAAAAVVVPRLNQRFLDYLVVDPADTESVAKVENLLLPGAMELDITKEDNGATLHVTQILRDHYTVMILVDFTAPEGTQLDMGKLDPPNGSTCRGFNNGSDLTADFLDETGERMGWDGMVSHYNWEVLEDDDPIDDHVSLMLTLVPQQGEDAVWDAVSLRVPAVNLDYWDQEQNKLVTVYEGDWSFEAPLPRQNIGWTMQLNQLVGELDGATITAEELYLSPMGLGLNLKREGGLDFGVPLDEQGEAAYGRWLSIGNNVQRLTLTTGEGETIPLELGSGGGGISFNEKVVVHRLSEITDPAKFQGGTLTLEWDFYNSDEHGSVAFSLDNLTPVEP